jgi:hypothetical protein
MPKTKTDFTSSTDVADLRIDDLTRKPNPFAERAQTVESSPSSPASATARPESSVPQSRPAAVSSDRLERKLLSTRVDAAVRVELKHLAALEGLRFEDWLIDVLNAGLIRLGHDLFIVRIHAPLSPEEIEAFKTRIASSAAE